MGLHWLDIASPELNGAEFRYTLFYGSWDGRIIFDEPMITKALLESRETVDVTLPPAARYASEGVVIGYWYWLLVIETLGRLWASRGFKQPITNPSNQ